jgi:polyketide biosynthesis enoyl-CoA hydratase PksH
MTEPRLLVRVADGRRTITFNRVERRNSFDAELLVELAHELDVAAADGTRPLVVLEGRGGFFCTGLDFEAVADQRAASGSSRPYLEVLHRIAGLPGLVVANVDGEVRAGGLGLVAASDLALATPTSTFNLPEALWGLVPACVGLVMAWRIGPHATKRMCLTTETLPAAKAVELGLIDEVSTQPEDVLRRLGLRTARLRSQTMGRIKHFFGEVAGILAEHEERAMQETDRALNDADVRASIARFVRDRTFPWNSRI